MRYRRQVHAELLGSGGVRVTSADSLADELRHLERGQPMPLLVLGDLRVAINGQLAQDNRHFAQTRSNRSAKSLSAEMDEVAAIAIRRMNDERLEDAALLDVRSQFFERGLGELGTRVIRILMQQRDGNEHRPAVRNAGL
jgi:CheY-like chemotaxis protein